MPPLTADDPSRVPNVVLEQVVHLPPQLFGMDDGRELAVELDAPIVQVRRSDHRRAAIDAQGLGVQRGVLALVQLDSRSQQVVVGRLSGDAQQADGRFDTARFVARGPCGFSLGSPGSTRGVASVARPALITRLLAACGAARSLNMAMTLTTATAGLRCCGEDVAVTRARPSPRLERSGVDDPHRNSAELRMQASIAHDRPPFVKTHFHWRRHGNPAADVQASTAGPLGSSLMLATM